MNIRSRLFIGATVGVALLTSLGLGLAASNNASPKAKPTPDPRIEERQAKAGMRFTAVQEPVSVSVEAARERAAKHIDAALLRPATEVKTELVRFSLDRPGADGKPIASDRLVWKVTFQGTRLRPEGRKPGTTPEEPTGTALDQSVAWVMIDANTGEIVATYSAGPNGQ